MRRAVIAGTLALLASAALIAQDAPREFLSGPMARRDQRAGKEPEDAKDYWVKNVHDPSITVFLPQPGKASGAAVIVVPGGGHRLLVFNAEGVSPRSISRASASPHSP